MKAKDLYKGRIYKWVYKLQDKFKFDVFIFSSKYGIISDDKIITTYETTLNGKGKKEIYKIGKELEIEKTLIKIARRYDKILISLSKNYLKAIEFKIPDNCYILPRISAHNRHGYILNTIVALYDYFKYPFA